MPLLFVLTAILFHTSCVRKSVFRSPYTNLQHSYHVMPVITDSTHSANYISLASTHGFGNDNWSDGLAIAQLKFHHAQTMGNFQGFLGAHAHAGFYRIDPSSYYNNYYRYDPWQDTISQYNGPAGRKFTGSVGINGGLTYTLVLGRKLEWRILGIEASLGREFGEYLDVRKQIPDSVITYTDKRNTPVTIGGFTELVFKPSNPRFRFGYQLAVGSGIHRMSNTSISQGNLTPMYVNNTFQFTMYRYTGYFQARVGDYFGGVQLGFSYRL